MTKTVFAISIVLTVVEYNKDPAVKTYFLVDIGECDFHEKYLQVSNTAKALLQLAEFKTSHVIQCKIEIRRTI